MTEEKPTELLGFSLDGNTLKHSFRCVCGLIQNCYSVGGGVQPGWDSHVSAASGTVRNCYATWSGGMDLLGSTELSGMIFIGNAAGSSGSAVSSADYLTITDCLIEGNRSAYDGGDTYTGTGHQAMIIGRAVTSSEC